MQNKKLTYFKFKGLLLLPVYLTLAVYTVFFVPRTVPAREEMKTVRVSEDALELAYNKSANTSYFTGTFEGVEMKSVTLTMKSGLELYGTNEFFIQMKARPEYYDLLIHKDTALFGERYSIYQIADEKKVLISYDFTAETKQKKNNQFFLYSIVILILIGVPLIRGLIKKIKEKKS